MKDHTKSKKTETRNTSKIRKQDANEKDTGKENIRLSNMRKGRKKKKVTINCQRKSIAYLSIYLVTPGSII